VKPSSGAAPKRGLTTAELKMLEHVAAHMDDWIDHIAERADQLFEMYGFEADSKPRDPPSTPKNGRRAA
jgi:hypothetical protein